MSDYKSLNDLAKESGITLAKVTNLLKGVEPEITIGRVKGFHPDALRAALINKLGEELKYLGVHEEAADKLLGFGAPDA